MASSMLIPCFIYFKNFDGNLLAKEYYDNYTNAFKRLSLKLKLVVQLVVTIRIGEIKVNLPPN